MKIAAVGVFDRDIILRDCLACSRDDWEISFRIWAGLIGVGRRGCKENK